MKKLERSLLKSLVGGKNALESFSDDGSADGGECNYDSDCGTRNMTCGGVTTAVSGVCKSIPNIGCRCRYSNAC